METMATSPLPSPNTCHEDKIRNGYFTLAVSGGQMWQSGYIGVPNAHYGDKMRNGYFTPTISGNHMWAKWLHHPYRLRSPQHPTRGQNQKWLLQPYRLWGLHMGKMATSPLPSQGSPKLSVGTKSEMAT